MLKTQIIYLIGFSGSGKSTIGPRIAKKLKIPFYDIDSYIEKKYRTKISRIFSEKGEKQFRKYEEKAIIEVTNNRFKKKVISLGGGAFQNSKIRHLCKENGKVIYLSCSQREIYRRMRLVSDRPLLKPEIKNPKPSAEFLKNKIKSMIIKRIKNYRKADIIISTTEKTIKASVTEIIKKFKKYHVPN